MTPTPFHPARRPTREVRVGRLGIGGANPIRVQSMITCDTMDTAASIAQTRELADVGCEIVRITAPTVKDAANLEHIVAGLRAQGCTVPIVADIHFKPDAAMEAAKWVEKIRINPGNYADSKKFKILEYTDEQYAAELERIRERFTPLVVFCKEHGRALRIGTNHGSLSDRIMNRYGDTPLGMVESALEFARIARDLAFHDFIFSMKSSNPKVMIAAYRLLAARLDGEGKVISDQLSVIGGERASSSPITDHRSPITSPHSWSYPLHLGVTEAGDGEDGRIKSAIGIGSLLSDGIGDTIRVSLTEDSIHEIPVARVLAERWRYLDTPKWSRIATKDPRKAAFPIRKAPFPTSEAPLPIEKVAFPTGPAPSLTGEAASLIRKVPSPTEEAPFPVGEIASPAAEEPESLAPALSFDPFSYRRRVTERLEIDGVPLGGEETIRVFTSRAKWDALAHKLDRLGDYRPEAIIDDGGCVALDPRDQTLIAGINDSPLPVFVTVTDGLDLPVIAAFRLLAAQLEERHPILLKDVLVIPSEVSPANAVEGPGATREIALPPDASAAGARLTPEAAAPVAPGRSTPLRSAHDDRNLGAPDFLPTLLTAATNIGSLLCDGIGDAILIQGEPAPGQAMRLSYNILQAAGARIFKTDYVACPSCGRTLFNLQTTTARIRAATSHLKGLKIAVMGCIVNGPGEMADADFGYVGGAPGKINLYVGKTPVKFNIPEDEAVERLKDLIFEHGKWVEPAAEEEVVSSP